MPIKTVSITNLGPFAGTRTFELPVVALIQGGNGAGKSGLQACIKYVGERGHDPDMLHGAAESGEVTLTMDTGHQLRATVKADSTTRSWRPPDGKRWTVSRELIDEICKAAAYDPFRFLDLGPTEQGAALLKLAPIEVDPAEVTTALAGVDASAAFIPPNGNPLECIDAIHAHIYERRREIRSQADSLEKHADELGRAVPAVPEQGFTEKLKTLRASKSTAEDSQRAAIAAVNQAYQKAKNAAETDRAAAYQRSQDEYERKLKEIEAERLGAHNAADAVCANTIEQAKSAGQSRAEEIRAEYRPSLDKLTSDISATETLAEQEQKAKGTIEARDAAKASAAIKREEWKRLDTAVENLRTLRLKLADRLPIKGVMVREGRIVREQDGGLVPLSKWNTADQYKLCLRIGMMVGQKAGFVCVDHVEAFDKKQRDALLKTCTKYAEENGMQFILASVDPEGSKLRVEDAAKAVEVPNGR